MNTAKIIRKVTITLSLINPNKDFNFFLICWSSYQNSLCILFSQLKFHYLKETHDINSLLTLVIIVLAPQHKENNQINLCQDLLTIENTDSGLKVHALHYANELGTCTCLSKTFQTRQTSRNNKKLCKKGFCLCLLIL